MLSTNVFKGKLVAVWANEPAKGCMMENARLQTLGDRSFIVGELADDGTSHDLRTGLTFWFPIDEVLMITEYPDVHAARAYYAEWMKQNPGSNGANR